MPYEPIVPEGQHLGNSRTTDGAVTGHLFDNANNLMGHAAWQYVDEPEEDRSFPRHQLQQPRPLTQEEIEFIAAVAALLVAGVIKVAPAVKKWWIASVMPAVRGFRAELNMLLGSPKRKSVPPTPSPRISDRESFTASAAAVESAVAKAEITMTRAEWARRYEAMLAANDFSAEQRRLLSVARIVELEGASKQELTPQQFAKTIEFKLAANPSLLEEQNAARVIPVNAATKAIEA